ncbi:Ldh family oxidoreductase [Haloarcula halophila]|uniref:Ldh family oxidoreductase n=1 Tax=Haloarcula TaxID=2237 RepID=UPI0023E44E16|nr:Ldh family oxidoreductase [Halomicroarcula sp. DFY41]
MVQSDTNTPRRFEPDQLREFVGAVLQSGGVVKEHAEQVAHGLVRADMRGVDSHGVSRLEAYMKKFEGGGFNPDPDIQTHRLGSGSALVDADDGPGQSAALLAMTEAMDLAEETGVGTVAVRNSNHFGTAAYYTEYASDRNYLGIAMTNVGSDVIPFGGATRFLGTNPISFSVPTDRSFPITLDMATSVVAMGKIQEVSRREDTEIPPEWAVNEHGEPTTDPHEAVAVRPLGGPKGYGLGIMVDVLSGVLSSAGTSPTVGPLYDDFDKPMRLGHFVAAIDIETFRDTETFKREIGEYIDQLKAIETRDGFDEIRLPGEIEAEQLAQQEEAGVELRPSTIERLRSVGGTYGVDLPEPVG